MRKFVHTALLVVVLLLVRSTIPAHPATAQSDAAWDEPPVWAPLGPSGLSQAGQIAVSSGWPADPFIIVTLNGADERYGLPSSPPPAARTYDGGKTWETVHQTSVGILGVLWTKQYGRVLLASRPVSDEPQAARYFVRSTDDGQTWSDIRTPIGQPGRLVVSPDVYRDGHVITIRDGQAAQSYDAGTTWEALDPAPGQHIGVIAFSPDTANDGVLYLTANSGPFSSVTGTRDARAEHHHADSAGVLVSRDRGRTWESTAAGLQIEGDPYRQIASFAISPTFARDGTLFAFAWGPWLGDNPNESRGPHTALFRSQDRGLTWEPVWEPFSRAAGRNSGVRSRTYFRAALSPAYADNGLVLATQGGSSGSPASGHCNLYRSHDYGRTWSSQSIVQSYGGCGDLRFATGDASTAIWSASSSGGGGWRSTDRRLRLPTWQGFGPRQWSMGSSPPGPTIGPDGTVFTYGTGGVWMFGPLERSTFGRLPCAATEPEPYASARLAAPYAQPWLGCPAGEPYTVAVRERIVGDTRALWTEDDDPRATLLMMSGDRTYGGAWFPKKDEYPWPGQPDRVFRTEVQRYEGGLMVRQPATDQRPASILVAAGFGWQEVSAP